MLTDRRAAVAAEERAILAAEGPFHVEGWFIRDSILCDRQRWLVAEYRVREAERRATWYARTLPVPTAPALADAA